VTITAYEGELKARFVNLYDNPTGVATAQRRIDAAASPGRFAGANGIPLCERHDDKLQPVHRRNWI